MKLEFYKKATRTERYIKGILPIMVCVLLVYSSCRKDNAHSPASTQTNSNAALSNQIAASLSKSLAGAFGGVNLNDGVNVSVEDHLGPHHACGCTNNPLCGFVTDSLVNYNAVIGDTTIHTGGNLKFYFNCINGKLSGYTAYDSLTTTKTTAASVSTYKVQQYYTIQALDSLKEFVNVNGTNDLHTSITFTNNSPAQIGGAFYELSNLKIDVINKDILSGTATVQAYGSNWNVAGTITFLGNHQADFDMNGTVYHITLTF